MKENAALLLHRLIYCSSNSSKTSYSELERGITDQSEISRKLLEMEKQHLLERLRSIHSRKTLYRITEKGYLKALGGRDPEKQWNRYWDGVWRFIIFTVPEKERLYRVRLRSELQKLHFGCLQRSVWVSPDNLIREQLLDQGIKSSYFMVIEGLPANEDKSLSLVSRAWDFSMVNEAWEDLSRHLDQLESLPSLDDSMNLTSWLTQEFRYLRKVVSLDPLLPVCLLPENYRGVGIWRQRKGVMQYFNKRIKTYF